MPAPSLELPVQVGFTWTSFFTGGSFLALTGLLIRQVGPWRKQTTDAEAAIREELRAQNAMLGKRIDALEGKLSRSERRHDAHIEIITQLHSAEIAVMRHRLGNESSVNDKLLATMRAGSPEKIAELVEIINADRSRREESIAAEQAELVKLRLSAMEKIERLRADDWSARPPVGEREPI